MSKESDRITEANNLGQKMASEGRIIEAGITEALLPNEEEKEAFDAGFKNGLPPGQL